MEDTPKHLPMDENDYGESFRQLLFIDEIARKSIKQKRESDTDTANLLRQSQNKHTKNIDRIMTIIADSSTSISKEQGDEIFRIIESPDLRAWESNITNMLKDYDKSQKVEILADAIIEIGKKISVAETTETKDSKTSRKIRSKTGRSHVHYGR